jgi:hypothetical protein
MKWTVLSCVFVALLGASAFASGLQVTEETFHCSSPCKIYVDGKLVASLSADGVRAISLNSAGSHTILITRPGKPVRTYKLSATEQFLVDPDDPMPRAIGEEKRENAGTVDSRDSKPDMSSKQSPAHPAWLEGLWSPPEPYQKHFRMSFGSVSCEVSQTGDMSLALYGPVSRLSFSQDLDIMSVDDACIEVERKRVSENDARSIKIEDATLRVTSVGDGEATFSAEISNCTKCRPRSITNIAGRIFRTSTGIRVVWGGQLAAAGETLMTAH